MNEEELKKIWQTDQTAPKIDSAGLQKLLNNWQGKLNRRVRIDIYGTVITVVFVLIVVFSFPKLIFASLVSVIFSVWYIYEIRSLSKQETAGQEYASVKDSLNKKILTMKNYFRRTRIAMYAFTPLIIPSVFYGLDNVNMLAVSVGWIFSLIISLVLYEILIIVAWEAWLKIIYKPAFSELKNLLQQLEAD